MKSITISVLTPSFTQTQLDILQVLIENFRNIGIVREFIITNKEELLEMIDTDPQIIEKLRKELKKYGMEYSETIISGSLMAITYRTEIALFEELILIGFGGLNATEGIYK